MFKRQSIQSKSVALAALLFGLGCSANASAQVQLSGRTLPLALASVAAQEAIAACEAKGYRVSVAVVDVSGLERAVLRGDHSTVHTRETAFKKAYTIVTLGPIFGATTTGALTERVNKTPTGYRFNWAGRAKNNPLLAGDEYQE